MQISGEGKIGIALGLVASAGTAIGLVGLAIQMLAPSHTGIGWAAAIAGGLIFLGSVIGGIALAIHHFGVHSPFGGRLISLQDASRKLYEAMQGTEWARGLDRHNTYPNETLDAAGYYIIHRADVFVLKPPSRVPMLFDKGNLSTMAALGGAKEIRDTKTNAVEFVDPSLRRSDFRKLTRELRKRYPH